MLFLLLSNESPAPDSFYESWILDFTFSKIGTIELTVLSFASIYIEASKEQVAMYHHCLSFRSSSEALSEGGSYALLSRTLCGKPEILNYKYETNSKLKCSNFSNFSLGFQIWVILICFWFRYSCFEFPARSAGGGRTRTRTWNPDLIRIVL